MEITWRRAKIHSKRPFHIARGGGSLEGREAERVFVRIEHDGLAGLGEAAPSAYYGQSCDSVEATLRPAAELLGDDPFRVTAIRDRLLDRFSEQPAAVAAIDVALHDWLGKRLGLPLWRLLGLDPVWRHPTSYTISLDQPGELPARVAEAAAFRVLKVKVGRDDDEQTLATVRKHAPGARLRVDANGAWSPQEARRRLETLVRFNVELIEQPIAAGQLDELAGLRRNSPVPIIADEDCAGVRDLVSLAGKVDGVNVKLAKCGGVGEALSMIRLARRLGLKVMLGCMIETSLGVSAAAHLSPLADYVDLDGHLLLADDPFDGLVLEKDVVKPADRPGLGVSLRA